MSDVETREIVTRAQPVLTDVEHMVNLATIISGMVMTGRFTGSVGNDAIDAYKKMIKAFMDWSDAGKPV
jgi:hypothetical protein